MKITILQGAFLPIPPKLGGGVEKMWFSLGKEFVKQGQEVVHISRKYENLLKEEYIEGVHHIRTRGFSAPRNGIYLKCLDFIYTLRAISLIPNDTNIIVSNTFWAPILLRKKFKLRCMVDVARMPKGQMKWYKRSSRLRANSSPVAEAIKNELRQAYYKKVVMIPNPLPFQVLSDNKLADKKKIILYVGRIHPEKGLGILINAFKKLKEGWILKIVGPSDFSAGGGGRTYLEHLVKLSKNSDILFMAPIFDMAQLNQLYAEAAIFVYPSVAEKGETFGLAPLEAMAWGCVPIVSDLVCFKDFIKDGYNGLIFDHRGHGPEGILKTAIERLQENSFRKILSEKALEVRDTHSCACIAKSFIEAFKIMAQEQST